MLAVDVLVPVEQVRDVVGRDRHRLAELAGEVHGLGNLLAHHRGLDGVTAVLADGEGAVIGHQDGPRVRVGEGLDDPPPDRVVPDGREGLDRDLPAELVAHHGQHARHRLAARGPGRRVGRVGVDHPADLRHVAVHVGVGRGVGGGLQMLRGAVVDLLAVEGADHHRIGGELVIGDARGLDDEEFGSGDPLRHVAGRPHDQVVAGQLGMQVADGLAGLGHQCSRSGVELGQMDGHDSTP